MQQVGYPYRVDNSGRTANANRDDHIRHLIEQVLFTVPGERVNRPDFGVNIRQFVFAGGNDETTAAAQFLVQGELERWLGEIIDVEAVVVESVEATLNITVRYTVRADQQRQIAQFER
ncbi:MAG: GPW/gp25 family protein [Caldilineaceae bacterium]